MNEETHWNNIAPTYNEQIFDVFKSDKRNVLQKYFKKYGNKKHIAIDFGCGNGKAFEYLSPLFKEVRGYDISQELLNQAITRPFNNIKVQQMDLASADLKIPPADFGFCCNVAMLPDIDKTHTIIANLQQSVKPGGAAVFVLPSLDSVLYSSWRLIDLYKKEGHNPDEIPNEEFHYFKGTKRDLIQGIIYIDNVPTKHFGEAELRVVFREAGFKIKKIDKVEYHWDSELASPPSWLKDPYPWDWLVECTK
jgi:SAM-dependent methyltransferase